MIDVENQLFTAVKTAVLAVDSSALVTGDLYGTPEKFPCVYFTESGNSTVSEYQTSGNHEPYSGLKYTVEIYTVGQGTRKSKGKKLRDAVDAVMMGLGFGRTLGDPVGNLNDTSVYRIICRYEAVIDTQTQTIYGR